MEQGWIKLHRKIRENPISQKPEYAWLWVMLLIMANHKQQKIAWNGDVIVIKEGQFLTGRKQLAKETGIKETTVERILKYLENGHQIEQQKTNKFRIITILNWKSYQDTDSKVDNKRTTDGQQTDTNNNDKNENNDKNQSPSGDGGEVNSLISLFKEVNPDYQKFYKIKGHREAVSFLIKEFGAEKSANLIQFLPKLNSMPYAPTVTNPIQLRSKLGDIKAYMEKERNKTKNNFKIAL